MVVFSRIVRVLNRRQGALMLIAASLLTTATVRAEENTIVFSLRRWDGEYETNGTTTPSTASIYSIRADGTALSRLVAIDGAVCDAPAYSTDGQWIYFQSNATGQYHLYRCKSDGSGREPLTTAERPGPPWTSVFGLQVTATGQLLCTAFDGAKGCVAVLAPDGSDIRLVAPHLGYLYMAAMGPRGDAVVVSGPASGYRLWLFELSEAFGKGAQRVRGPTVDLAPNHPESFAPQFTPDGRTIIYLRRDGDVYRVERDGTGRRRLTTGNRYVEFRLSAKDRHGSTDSPRLSPDGRRVAFIALRGGTPQVCSIGLDGSDLRQLTFRVTPCGRARWSPDGTQLAFVSFEGKYPQLFVMPAAGGTPRRLTQLDGAVYLLNWAPRR